jgi:rod shape-determining protein MreD
MAYFIRDNKSNFLAIMPIFLLFFIALNGKSIINLNFISISIHYILVYYWTLRKPEIIGYGFVFLSGIVNDVLFGTPLGVSSLSLLTIAAVASYVRVVTVRITLLNDWISFFPAVLIGNFIYFLALYFSNYPVDYFLLFKNSIFTFVFYPILWIGFTLFSNLLKS